MTASPAGLAGSQDLPSHPGPACLFCPTSWASRASCSSSMLLLTAMGIDSSQGTWNLHAVGFGELHNMLDSP